MKTDSVTCERDYLMLLRRHCRAMWRYGTWVDFLSVTEHTGTRTNEEVLEPLERKYFGTGYYYDWVHGNELLRPLTHAWREEWRREQERKRRSPAGQKTRRSAP